MPKVLVTSNRLETDPLWMIVTEIRNIEFIQEPDPASIVKTWLKMIPDLVLFDSDPLDDTILSLVKDLRGETVVPILMLTTSLDVNLILRVYEAGADDCILQPILPAIFRAKLHAWLRHSSVVPVETLDPLRIAGVYLIPAKHLVSVNDRPPVRLTSLQMRLLYILMSRPGQPVGTGELIEKMWGVNEYAELAALKNVVYRLRKKIESDPAKPRFIQNVASIGYLFNAEGEQHV